MTKTAKNSLLAADTNQGSVDTKPDVLTIFPSKLYGEVTVGGAKNSTLALLAATLLTAEDVHLSNFPDKILDAQIQIRMLNKLGKKCDISDGLVKISQLSEPPEALTWNDRSIRTSLLMLGSLLARKGHAEVPHPGGCPLGSLKSGRAYDIHVMVLEQLGARVRDNGGTLTAEAPRGLIGCDIELPLRSTGATENAILAATLAVGTTRIWNPHIRPEIIDLINLLRKMGSSIHVHGQEHIEVIGKESLSGASHRVIPDNVEALTWVIAAVITKGEIEIHDFPFTHLELPLIYLRESGARLFRGEGSLVVRGGRCYPLELSTGPYPGINSDMQPLMAVYGACAKGESRFIDLRFPGRYAYADELAKMGLSFNVEGNVLRVHGGTQLKGAAVRAIDLRAGAGLSLAALVAEGPTHIHDAWQIARGYSQFGDKLRKLGARADDHAHSHAR